ncbi:Rab5 GDP/GTP exchange factor [Intoshia linei]|uniref:Rab5 GDP/GTP exchange factor n=1 Tax=Intoshia linei TaxID=1819745 RepID=A0A177B0Q1_9BILA|nr:Rab5 GDP/GTP exchange factor [Intoshia linei]
MTYSAVPCRNNCGFYGNEKNLNLCSKCFNESKRPTEPKLLTFKEKLAKRKDMFKAEQFRSFDPISFVKKYVLEYDTADKDPKPVNVTRKLKKKSISDKFVSYLKTFNKPIIHDMTVLIKETSNKISLQDNSKDLDGLAIIMAEFYQLFNDRMENCDIYKELTERDKKNLVKEIEIYLSCQFYHFVFDKSLAYLETADLEFQMKIRKLAWVNATVLGSLFDEENSQVKPIFDQAIETIILMDTKCSPYEKLQVVSDTCHLLFNAIGLNGNKHPNQVPTDEFLSSLILLIIRSNPSRLKANCEYIQRLTYTNRLQFGESAFFFVNYNSAISFIESISAKSLNIESRRFKNYMNGTAFPPSHIYKCDGIRHLKSNEKRLASLIEKQERLQQAEIKIKISFDAFIAERCNQFSELNSTLDNFISKIKDDSLEDTESNSEMENSTISLDDNLPETDNLPPPLIP